MIEKKIADRIEFLAKSFDVFEVEEKKLLKKVKTLEEEGHECELIENGDEILCISSTKIKNKNRVGKHVSISFKVFSDIISADPTPNKSCAQWMLNVFVRYIREGGSKKILAIRFVSEDLPQANEYIRIFEANKRKQRFKELSKSSYILKGMLDPTDINQYKSLSQLFDAVDPFIERDPTEVEKLLNRYVSIGEAIIPVRDRKFTVFVPKTVHANVIFDKFANWCTAKAGNSMFTSYTTNNRKPNGEISNIYIIINNKFFTGESDEIYQLHFETSQIKDRHNSQVSLFENVMSESESVGNYFKEELLGLAKMLDVNYKTNKYIGFLVQFGFCESLFELIDENSPSINFMDQEIPRLPDISKFKVLDYLIMVNCGLSEIHPSIGKLNNLEMLVLPDNKLTTIPSEIGGLKKLIFINLIGNSIKTIPDEIKYLDTTNGGSLYRIAIKESEIGGENYKTLKKLLPSVVFL